MQSELEHEVSACLESSNKGLSSIDYTHRENFELKKLLFSKYEAAELIMKELQQAKSRKTESLEDAKIYDDLWARLYKVDQKINRLLQMKVFLTKKEIDHIIDGAGSMLERNSDDILKNFLWKHIDSIIIHGMWMDM